MSNSWSSVRATRRTSAATRLTPRLKLPDLTTIERCAAVAISFSFSGDRPVVPMTCTRPCFATISANATVAAGMVKSILDAVGAEPGELARIAADHRRAFGIDGARQHHAVGIRDRLDEGAAHAPAGARHDQPHAGHD